MMSGHYSFTSCFAPFIESMITEKRNAGFQYEHAEWILHKFDEFCNQEQVETPVITQELAGKWGTLRKTETKVTLAGRISVLRQLSLYMQAYGIKCYIPRNFTRKSNRSAYVLSIEEIQSLFVVLRMNEWMKSGVKLDNMMPYLSKYLGHSSPDDTFYYYHQVEEAFSIIKQKDQSASFVIPEVADEK